MRFRSSSARSASIRASRWPTRRCRACTADLARRAEARSWRAWRSRTASTSASASGCSSPISTTTASPAIRRRRGRRSRSGSAPIRVTTGRRTRWRCCSTGSATTMQPSSKPKRPSSAIRRTRSRSRTWRMRCAAPAGSRRRARSRNRRSRAISAPVRCGGCSISSPSCDRDAAAARAQIEWAAQSPVGFDITGARAQVAAFHGRMTEARQLFAETIAAATDRGFTQVASGYAAQAALTEALYGYERTAREQARAVVQQGHRERTAAARRHGAGAGRWPDEGGGGGAQAAPRPA